MAGSCAVRAAGRRSFPETRRAARLASLPHNHKENMGKRLLLALFCCLAVSGIAAAWAAAPAQVNFGSSDNLIELKESLTPYHAPGGPEADVSVWYMLSVSNNQVRPAIRVLIAGQPPRLALSLLPRTMRPAILAVA